MDSQAATDLSMLLSGSVFAAGAFWSAYKRRFWTMIFCASTTLLLKLWYVDRMVSYYERHRDEAYGEARGATPARAGTLRQRSPREEGFHATASRLVLAADC